jgi:capsular exopolysaccharide synthesis family protein
MSKHFELMQQMERAPKFGDDPIEELEFRSPRTVSAIPTRQRWASEEALRLVQQIFLLQAQEPPHVVVFAGIDHQNGCSSICAAVAETLARDAGRSVCLVEANFRSPSLPEMFGTSNHFGLTDSLLRDEPVSTFIRPVSEDNLCLLSTGKLAVDSANLLTSDRLRERLIELRQVFDFVIIDAPPLTRYSDAVVLGQLSDGLVLVIEADATRREAAAVAAANLRSVNVPILAAVLNKRTYPIPEKIYGWL